jgi:prepilin-type N-terminal cleavage/methylation domain-containing protein
MKRAKKVNGFTLIEILVVLLITGIIAAIAIPNFTVSIERTRIKDGVHNLLNIYSAQQSYRNLAGNGSFCTAACTNITTINTILNMNIINAGAIYACAAHASGFVCTAKRDINADNVDDSPGFTLTLTNKPIRLTGDAASRNPLCTNTGGSTFCPP